MNFNLKTTIGARVTIYLFICVLLNILFDNIYIGLVLVSFIEIVTQINRNNFISTYTFWNLGFITIICLDGILSRDEIILKTSLSNYNYTSYLFLISQLLIITTYRVFEKRKFKDVFEGFYIEVKDKLKPLTFLLIIILYFFFLFYEFPNAFNSFFTSRFEIIRGREFGGLEGAKRSVFSSIAYFISGFAGYILPSLIFIWFNRRFSPLLSFLLSLFPSGIIWFIYLVIGTRHHILFSFLGLVGTYSLINSHKIKFRYSFIVLLVAGYFISNKIVDIRRHGFVNYLLGEKIEKYEKVTKDYSTDKTTVYLNYVVDYYEEENLRYGQSTLAVIFFWVPRKFWPEKPPQFGYWFIRDYLGGQKGFGDKFSAPASYLGVPYSDFAIVGVILISLFIGWLSNFVDEYFRKNSVFKSNKQVVILSFCLASFFFLPRQLNQFFSKFIVIVILLNFLFYINRISLVYKNDK